jgi:hypothetical protein
MSLLSATESAVQIIPIGWNELTKNHWLLCAENAGDADWRHTKRIAEKFIPMGLDMVYHGDVLHYVLYVHRSTSSFTGKGYKGRGMLDREKATMEEDFIEVNDPYWYVYMRKTAILLKKKYSDQKDKGEKITASSYQHEVNTSRKKEGHNDSLDAREQDSHATNGQGKEAAKEKFVNEGEIMNATPITYRDPANSIVEERTTGWFYTPCSRTPTFGNDETK